MSDPLSIAASAAGFVSLGIEVTKSLVEYYKSYTGQTEAVANTVRKLENLLEILVSLKDEIDLRRQRGNSTLDAHILKTVEQCSLQCSDSIRALQQELDSLRLYSSQNQNATPGFRNTIRTTTKKLAYPFRESTLKKIEEDVGDLRENLAIALNVMQIKDSHSILHDLAELKEGIDSVAELQAFQITLAVREWLNAPDPYLNHDRCLRQRYVGTGLWFIESRPFRDWINGSVPLLWVQGFAGRGKTVLCSAAVQYAVQVKKSDRKVGAAFYYFSFQEESKQDISGLLRSLLIQLASQLEDGPAILQDLYDRFRDKKPLQADLVQTLQEVVRKFTVVYLLCDAIDEVPSGPARDLVLAGLRSMRSWSSCQLRILITSRDLEEIRIHLSADTFEEVSMKSEGQDKDIESYIVSQLATDTRLMRWRNFHELIKDNLTRRAGGVFRWVDCQLQHISRLPKSESYLRRALSSLPDTLEKTYERMLSEIDKDFAADAKQLLTVLSFTRNALTVSQVIEALAVDLDGLGCFDSSRMLSDAEDLSLLCPGLVESAGAHMQISHFSVQEYLTSSQIQSSRCSYFALDPSSAHFTMAKICLIRLQQSDAKSRSYVTRSDAEASSFLHYAASCWYYHYHYAINYSQELDAQLRKLIDMPEDHLTEFLQERVAKVPVTIQKEPFYVRSTMSIPTEISTVTGALLVDASERMEEGGLIEPISHPIACLLQCSSLHEKTAAFRQLIDLPISQSVSGRNLDVESTLLFKAVELGLTDYVKSLLDVGADPDSYYLKYDARDYRKTSLMVTHERTPLSAAVRGGFEDIVALLITSGADVNETEFYEASGMWGSYTTRETPLDKALESKNERIAEMLRQAGGKPHES